MTVDEMPVLLLGPSVFGGHQELERLAVCAEVVVGLHEIFDQDFPVKVALPLPLIDDFKFLGFPRGDGRIHFYQASSKRRRVAS